MTAARLHCERLGVDGATRLVAFTHGVYGSGANWRSIARQVLARAPGWGAVLIDLRQHGRSEGGAPPHTLAACIDDVVVACAELARAGAPVAAAVGHSFGGKVVLGLDVARRVILDSTPSARPGAWDRERNSVRAAWDSMAALDQRWPRRDDFVAALIARGHAATLAGWLAMNLAPVEGGLRLRLDLAAVRALVVDYYAVDLWSRIDTADTPITMVVAERGDTVSPDDLRRLEHAPPAVTTHVIAGASHWLHLDAPAAVVEHVVAALL